MRLPLYLALALACTIAGAGPATATTAYSVSCRIEPGGRIVATRHEPRDIYEHASSFAGRSHQSPDYRGRSYGWRGRVPITDTLYSEYRQLPRFRGRQAFARIGSTDGTVYVFVQALGCLFDRYVPRPDGPAER